MVNYICSENYMYMNKWLVLNHYSRSIRIDLIMTTSRGKGLENHLSSNNFITPKRIITISGASLDTLTSEALRIINTHPTPQKIHTYFIAGIPDITSRIRDVGYEEVIFIDNVETAHHNFMTQVKNTKETIAFTNSIPCFATIAPMSFYTWNTTRMNQHKTQYLIHHNYYEDKQSLLTQVIIKINASIIETNDESNMHTPKLGTPILHKQNSSRDSHRTRYGRLVDGLHPIEETKIHWAGDILQSIMINRVNHR